MSHSRLYRVCLLLVTLTILTAASAQAEGRTRRKPITIGPLIVNAEDIIAVYRPTEQSPVEVFVAKPGHAVQVLVFHEFRDSQAVFNDLWANNDVCKDPGEEDARPLTRMKVKNSGRGPTTLIANIGHLLAVVADPNHRGIHIYLDRGVMALPLPDPENNGEREYLDIQNSNSEADIVLAAYKAALGE